MESKNYKKVKDKIPLKTQIKVLEDLLKIERREVKRLTKLLNLPVVTGSIGKDTKPTLMTMTIEERKKYGIACNLCKYENTPLKSLECRKCVTENELHQYYL